MTSHIHLLLDITTSWSHASNSALEVHLKEKEFNIKLMMEMRKFSHLYLAENWVWGPLTGIVCALPISGGLFIFDCTFVLLYGFIMIIIGILHIYYSIYFSVYTICTNCFFHLHALHSFIIIFSKHSIHIFLEFWSTANHVIWHWGNIDNTKICSCICLIIWSFLPHSW